jgi:hypothetical protein
VGVRGVRKRPANIISFKIRFGLQEDVGLKAKEVRYLFRCF